MPTITIGGVVSSYNLSNNAPSSNDYYDVPTNAKLTLGSYATDDKLFTIIYEDGSISNDTIERPVSSGDIHEEYSNLHNTNGFTIRCFDNATNTGVNLSSINLANNEYYVLINSNESNLYHFAKITSVGNADVQGDKFEFSPKLGNEVAKGIKFKIFKGPSNTDKIIAVSAGIDKDISLLNIARPYFYFYNDKLDKQNELNHNTKYMLRSNDVNKSSSVNSVTINNVNHAFTTVADHRYKIIDYSKFTYKIKLEDKLKLLDDPNTATSNESTLLSSTYTTTTDYNNSFINARRDVNDDASSLDLTGPKRYVYYNFSPEDNNRMPNVYECNIADSFDAKAGYASLKLIDSTKNLSNKIFNNDRLFVNQKLSEENLNDWVEVGTINALVNAGTRTYSLEGTVERPNLYFSVANEIKIGDRICIVSGIASTHNISLATHSRLTTESIFTSATSLTSFSNGTKVYRKRLNPVDNTFFTETNISASKLEKLNAIILSNQYTNFYCRMGSFISNVDEDYGLLTLTFENNLMDSETALRYVFGEILLNYQVFFGEVEEINKSLENQQSVFEIQGRNTLSKLVDIIVNRNTVFSEDIIYSSNSPYNKLTPIVSSGNSFSFNMGDSSFATGILLNNWNSPAKVGDLLYCSKGLVGEITALDSVTGQRRIHITDSLVKVSNEPLYIPSEKNYILTKALSSARTTIDKPTSLTGSAEKGLIFTSGVSIKQHGFYSAIGNTYHLALQNPSTYGDVIDSLVGTSQNTNTKAIGYDMHNPSGIVSTNIDNDPLFQSLLKDERGAGGNAQFDTVNTLMDFEVISSSTKDGKSILEIAPYIPFSLGRKETHEGNVSEFELFNLDDSEFTYTEVATVAQIYTLTSFTKIRTYAFASTTATVVNLKSGDALYVDSSGKKEFIGRVAHNDHIITHAGSGSTILMDRTYTGKDGNNVGVEVGDKIYTKTSQRHDINLINGAHLWGGKMVSLIDIKVNNGVNDNDNTLPNIFHHIVPLNFENISSTSALDNWDKFGNPYYKVLGLEKGRFGEEKPVIYSNFTANNVAVSGKYSTRPSVAKYNLPSYNFKPNISAINLLNDEKTETAFSILPVEKRGRTSPFGSNIPNSSRVWRGTTTNPCNNDYAITDPLYQMNAGVQFFDNDDSFPRLFLYSTCDYLPYSPNRVDSLDNKNLEDFSALLIENKQKNDIAVNKGAKIKLSDDNFQTISFQTTTTLNTLKQYSLMRLTEVVFDEMFSIVNPEKNTSVYQSNDVEIEIPVLGYSSLGVNINSMTTNTATFNSSIEFKGTTDLFNNDLEYIGRVGAGTGTTHTFSIGPYRPNNSTSQTGIYARRIASKTDKHTGRKEKDTILKGTAYHPLKGGIVPNNDSSPNHDYGGDSSDIIYSRNNNVEWPEVHGGEIILPTVFDGETFTERSLPSETKITFLNGNKSAYADVAIIHYQRQFADSGSLAGGQPIAFIFKTTSSTPSYSGNTAAQSDVHIIDLTSGSNVNDYADSLRAKINSTPALSNYITARDINGEVRIYGRYGGHTSPTVKQTLSGASSNNAQYTLEDGQAPYSIGTTGNRVLTEWYKSTLSHVDNLYANAYNGTMAVVLDRYSIEDTDMEMNAEAGNVSAVLGNTTQNHKVKEILIEEAGNIDYELITVCTDKHFKRFRDSSNHLVTSGQDTAGQYPADGAYLGFKARLWSGNLSATPKKTSGGTAQLYTINLSDSAMMINKWLEFVDLTGCYLVKEKATATTDTIASPDGENTNPIYVYSHELNGDTSNAINIFKHNLLLSESLSADSAYRIFQPNPICMYSFSPKDIFLNTPSHEYTKMANQDKMYGEQKSHYFYETGGDTTFESTGEAVLSMYVLIDPKKTETIIKTTYEDLPQDRNFYLTDGENGFKTTVVSTVVDGKTKITFSDTNELHGIVSMTEPFTITSNQELSIDPNRLCIGTTVSVVQEVEELVDELMRLEDINFDITTENYPIYASPDFQGTNLFNVLNYLLHLKDKKMVNVEGQIKIINYDDTDFNAQYSFTDDDLTEIRTIKSNFNYFNEVIVYGKNHKAIRKDFREIKKKGKKTLEIFEDKLNTKEDVEREAQEKLIMHTQLQELIECKIPVSKSKCLDVGETIILQSKVAGIEPRPFLILEKIQSFDGSVKLKLGKYIKGIDDTIADLLLDTKQTKSYIRNKSFNVNENAFDFFDSLKIKEMHLLIRKKASTGTNLGFRTTLNTNTTPMGFADGTQTFTTLVEEDL